MAVTMGEEILGTGESQRLSVMRGRKEREGEGTRRSRLGSQRVRPGRPDGRRLSTVPDAGALHRGRGPLKCALIYSHRAGGLPVQPRRLDAVKDRLDGFTLTKGGVQCTPYPPVPGVPGLGLVGGERRALERRPRFGPVSSAPRTTSLC
jgi:hypothetical protein